MSIELSVSTGGLVFEVTPLLDADQIETLLAPALADHGYPVQSVSSIGVIGLQVTCDKLLLWFNLENRSYAPPRLRVTAQPMGAADNPADRTRLRVTWLIDRAVAASAAADHATAIVALDLALAEDPDSAVAQKLLHRHQPAILDVYQAFVGNLEACPTLAIPMHELSDQRLDTRATFLLSRVDGTITFEEILDVAGMQRLEAFRHLSMLLLRGILGVR